MASDKDHITYSAADMLRYAQGQMSPSEMHALEKAALEDPFLAEALEGFMSVGETEVPMAGVNEQLERMRRGIVEKAGSEERTRVIPLWRNKWIQYAVAASVILAGGWWILSISGPKEPLQKDQPLAIRQNGPDKTMTDTVSVRPLDTRPKEPTVITQQPGTAKEKSPEYAYHIEEKLTASKVIEARPGLAKPANTDDVMEVTLTESDATKWGNDSRMIPMEKKALPAAPVTAPAKDEAPQLSNGYNKNINNNGNRTNLARFTFNGKVVNANNEPLPYSNVMIPGENVGTYADSKGYFNFIYVDSVLPVRAKSLGYEPQTITMRPDLKENKIVLHEDEAIKNTELAFKRVASKKEKSFQPTIVERDSIVNTEPSVGWSDFNLYALNNNRLVNVPAVKGDVKLSFDVDANGEITNINVEQSLGKEQDEEAIRLLKEGPKWKLLKGNRGKAKVRIRF